MPVLIGMLWPTRAAAQNCPKGDIRLFFCDDCGFIFNPVFDPPRVRYTEGYDNSLHFSPSYKAYAESMASRLIERHHIFDKKIIEIGCGKGDFLILLSKLGNNQCIGFDPTFEKRNLDPQTEKKVTFIPDNYSGKYSHHKSDLICSRHVLEHILSPKKLIELTWNCIRKGSKVVLYFEVPNVEFILRDISVWDIIYEHCSYFGICSIDYLFKSCGFDVLDVAETFGRQFICIESSPFKNGHPANIVSREKLEKINQAVQTFSIRSLEKLEYWQYRLEKFEAENRKVVIWGAGAKGVSFLNMLSINHHVEYAVDLNPNKQDKYIAGTGQKIVPPQFLKEYQPDTIIIMNTMYKDEIQKTIDDMGITATLLGA